MRVTVVNTAYDPWLTQPDLLLRRYHSLTGWSDAVAQAGAQVRVVQAFGRDADVGQGGIAYRFVRLGAGARHVPDLVRLAKVVRDTRPDVVHVNGLDRALPVLALRRALPSCAIVAQHHGGRPARRNSPRAPLVRAALRSLDGLLFTSRALAEPWVMLAGVDEARVHDVLEASTRLGPVPRHVARAHTGVTGSPALLWVGRLDANKDPLTVLDALKACVDPFPGITLTMLFGDDELLPVVRARVEGTPSLRGRVRLVGGVPHAQIANWFASADLFVLASHDEAAGYAAIEACACGVPPVLSDISPFRAITHDGRIGRHFGCGDSAACAGAILAVASRAGDAVRDEVRAHFDAHLSWRAVGQRACEVYAAVHAGRTRPGGGESA